MRAQHAIEASVKNSSFQAIHDHYRPRVLAYLARVVGRSEAEDLAQSVMLKISEGLRDFRGDSSVSTWIYRIATNAALDRLRRKSVPGEDDPDLEEALSEAHIASAEATVVREEMRACIQEFIERLPPEHRTVVVLGEIEGFRNAEIAAILGITLATAKIRLHRARARLRAELQAGCAFYRDNGGELACDRKPSVPSSCGRAG
jgi:RNA polymerase sigma-70 factor, ECF subfamily